MIEGSGAGKRLARLALGNSYFQRLALLKYPRLRQFGDASKIRSQAPDGSANVTD